MEQRVMFAGEAGPLEGVLTLPEGPGPFPAIVMCHPHPLYGGSQHDNVVAIVCRSAERQGIASLRFNFRGVGASAGTHDHGNGEQQDAKAALQFLAAHENIDPQRLGLAGYSFGAGVSARLADTLDHVKALVLVSLPARTTSGLLEHAAMPKLIIAGGEDDIAPSAALQELGARLTPPADVVIVPHTDHFWSGAATPLSQTTGEFFAKHLT